MAHLAIERPLSATWLSSVEAGFETLDNPRPARAVLSVQHGHVVPVGAGSHP